MITKERLQHQIERTKKLLADLEKRQEHLSKHGYWDMGYYKGKLEVLENWLDELEETDMNKSTILVPYNPCNEIDKKFHNKLMAGVEPVKKEDFVKLMEDMNNADIQDVIIIDTI